MDKTQTSQSVNKSKKIQGNAVTDVTALQLPWIKWSWANA